MFAHSRHAADPEILSHIFLQDPLHLCPHCAMIDSLRAISSAGRALRSQRRGQGFDPLIVHHKNPVTAMATGFVFSLLALLV